MTEEAKIWEPVADLQNIEGPFHSIEFAYLPDEARSVRVTMHGRRDLCLRFEGALALRFEDDCPGFDPLPHPFPMIRRGVTFPLLKIMQPSWLSRWEPSGGSSRHLTHFALLSLDDLVQLIAKPDVKAFWV